MSAGKKFQQGAASASVEVRMALMEQAQETLEGELADIKTDVRTILKTLNEMSGGKKAVMWLFSIIGAAVGIVATVVGMGVFKDR